MREPRVPVAAPSPGHRTGGSTNARVHDIKTRWSRTEKPDESDSPEKARSSDGEFAAWPRRFEAARGNASPADVSTSWALSACARGASSGATRALEDTTGLRSASMGRGLVLAHAQRAVAALRRDSPGPRTVARQSIRSIDFQNGSLSRTASVFSTAGAAPVVSLTPISLEVTLPVTWIVVRVPPCYERTGCY